MNILEEAASLVSGDRQKDYGHPLDNYTCIAAIWSAILKVPLSAEQAALCMAGVKMARLAHGYKRDSAVDLAGYAAVIAEIIEERSARNELSQFDTITVCRYCGSVADAKNHACGDGS